MGCCSPEYRKTVNEIEEKVNKNGRDSLPFWFKIISIIITAGGLTLYFLN